MPNQRHPDQEMVAFALDGQLLEATDDARKLLGQDRSTFIRVAVVGELNRGRADLPEPLAYAPDRTGTGPGRLARYSIRRFPGNPKLNEPPGSATRPPKQSAEAPASQSACAKKLAQKPITRSPTGGGSGPGLTGQWNPCLRRSSPIPAPK